MTKFIPMKEYDKNLGRVWWALAGCVLLGAADVVAESVFSIDVIRDSNNDAFVEFTTRPWFSYDLEKSSDLLTWEPSGVTAYGFGQTVRTFVYDDVSTAP